MFGACTPEGGTENLWTLHFHVPVFVCSRSLTATSYKQTATYHRSRDQSWPATTHCSSTTHTSICRTTLSSTLPCAKPAGCPHFYLFFGIKLRRRLVCSIALSSPHFLTCHSLHTYVGATIEYTMSKLQLFVLARRGHKQLTIVPQLFTTGKVLFSSHAQLAITDKSRNREAQVVL